MKITNEEKIVKIILPHECTISQVESATDKVKSSVNGAKSLVLEINSVEEIDTAYFQLLLSLKTTAFSQDIQFLVSGVSKPLEEMCEIYGVSF